MKYTEPRYTEDLDIWVYNSLENSTRVFHALAKFAVPLQHDKITPETFINGSIVYQIGVAPVRIDILTQITGIQFIDAWQRRVKSSIFGVPVHFLSLDDLIVNKQAVGRSNDLEQLEHIKRDKAPKAE
jgi:predicted nucleotidyltransferase